MHIRILGSAAGGGFPQWNCSCHNCASARAGRPGFRPRTQTSIAVSADGESWVVFNASPDLRQQINDNPALGSKTNGKLRNSPIKAAVITGGDIDFIAGLLHLRELEPFTVYASRRVLDTLAANSVFNVLDGKAVSRRELPFDKPVDIEGPAGPLGIRVESFDVPGKVALYLEDAAGGPGFGTHKGDTIGLRISVPATSKHFYFVPGCAKVDAPLAARIKGAPLVFFDGTLYTDDEMLKQGLMPKTGARMGHMSMSGPDGTVAAFAGLDVARKIFVHINNSNPVLDDNSPERKAVEGAGWTVGEDGMEVTL